MNEVVFKTLKEKDFIIKSYLIKIATELKLSLSETLLLVYFMNQDEPQLNVPNIMATIYLSEQEIIEAFSKLESIGLITINVTKSADGTVNEIISLDNIIKQVTTDITKSHKKETDTNLFEVFEREFGRQLSTMEYEIINEWLNTGYSKELIIEALRESIYNGVKSLKYISKILLSWKEKGIKSKNDVNNSYKDESLERTSVNLFSYNWLDEE